MAKNIQGQPPAAVPESTEPDAPKVIRALMSFWTVTEKGHPYHVGFRDIYSGDEAVRLYGLHPDRFEAYVPPVPR